MFRLKFAGTPEATERLLSGFNDKGLLSLCFERTGRDKFRVTAQCRGVVVMEGPDLIVGKRDVVTIDGVYLKVKFE
jgi:hypothetical protein